MINLLKIIDLHKGYISFQVLKGITAGFLVIVINFLLIPVTKVKAIGNLMPYKLIDLSNSFTFKDSFKAIIFVLLTSLIFMAITIYRMEKVEVI